MVIGTTITAFQILCPDRPAMLHSHYRKMTRMLLDADEWAQTAILEALLIYIRRFLAKAPGRTALSMEQHHSSHHADHTESSNDQVDIDLQQTLQYAASLLSSRNAGVRSTSAN